MSNPCHVRVPKDPPKVGSPKAPAASKEEQALGDPHVAWLLTFRLHAKDWFWQSETVEQAIKVPYATWFRHLKGRDMRRECLTPVPANGPVIWLQQQGRPEVGLQACACGFYVLVWEKA